MALIKCSECKKEISNEASVCPNCGKPVSVKKNLVPFVIIFLGVLFLALSLFTRFSLDSKQLLVGTWKSNKTTITVFKEGNIFIKQGNNELGGSYIILDDNIAKVNLDGLGALAGTVSVNYDVSITDLTIKYNKNSETLKRTSDLPFILKIIKILFIKQDTNQINSSNINNLF